MGLYIADFYCHKARLVVEVDGGQHLSNDAIEYDKLRDKYMEGLGLKVLRFTNAEVLTAIQAVLEKIKAKMLENT